MDMSAKQVVAEAFRKIDELRNQANNAIKEKLRQRYEAKKKDAEFDDYVKRLETFADDWKTFFHNGKLVELQNFLKSYREDLLKALVESTDKAADIALKERVKVFDMLINEPRKVIKEYEAWHKKYGE